MADSEVGQLCLNLDAQLAARGITEKDLKRLYKKLKTSIVVVDDYVEVFPVVAVWNAWSGESKRFRNWVASPRTQRLAASRLRIGDIKSDLNDDALAQAGIKRGSTEGQECPTIHLDWLPHFLGWLSQKFPVDLAIWWEAAVPRLKRRRSPVSRPACEHAPETIETTRRQHQQLTDELKRWYEYGDNASQTSNSERRFYQVYSGYVVQGALNSTPGALKKRYNISGTESFRDYLLESHRRLLGEAEELAARCIEPTMSKLELKAALKMAGLSVFGRVGILLDPPSDPSRATITVPVIDSLVTKNSAVLPPKKVALKVR